MSGIQELIMFLNNRDFKIEEAIVLLEENSIVLKYNYRNEKVFERNGKSVQDLFLELEKGLNDSWYMISRSGFASHFDPMESGIKFFVGDGDSSFCLYFASAIEKESKWINNFCEGFVNGYSFLEDNEESKEIIKFIELIKKKWAEEETEFQSMKI